MGLSPDIIFTLTSCFLKYSSVSLAFLRILSLIIIKAIISFFSLLNSLFILANDMIRYPLDKYSSNIGNFVISKLVKYSKAPMAYVPSLNSTMAYFLLEENGILFTSCNVVSFVKYFFIALSVALPSVTTIPAIIFSILFFLSKATTLVTLMLPSVMVPVLSKHKISVQASNSIPDNF